MPRGLPLVLRLAFVLVVVCQAEAQASTGTILGTVRDAQGGVLPGATVAAIDSDTNRRVVGIAGDVGIYVIPNLPPGRYIVEASLAGFKISRHDAVTVPVDGSVRVDLDLQPGGITETIVVTTTPRLVETASSALGTLVTTAQIQALPLNTRNVYSLVALTPGVTGQIGNVHNSLSYSVNGVRGGLMDTLIDGASASFPTVNGFHGISVFPPVDAVKEFKVESANYNAEFGRSLANVLNLVYKSGGNELRGSAWEFYRNSRFDENPYFNQQRGLPLPDLSRSQFGSVLSGPLVHDRTFFMTAFEGLRQRSFRETLTTMPTLIERAGDFSQTRGANGQTIVIYDPLTLRPNPSGSGSIRDPFPGNRIPLDRMDPVALNVLRYWPQPNQPGDVLTGRNNFYASGAARVDTDNADIRIDHVLTGGGRVFGRYSYRRSLDAPPQLFPGETGVAEGRVNQTDHGHNLVLDYSAAMRRASVVDIRLAFARTRFEFDNQGLGFSPTSLGLPPAIEAAVDRAMFPGFGVADVASLGGNDHRSSGFNNYSLGASVTRASGRHLLKLGYDGRMFRDNVWEARAAGSFSFTRQFTQGPNPLAATALGGYGFASFLLGAGSSGSLIQNWKNVASQSFYHAVYLQDDWRLHERLTINLGVRYDVDLPRTERYNRMSWFDPDARSPLADAVPGFSNLSGGLRFVGVDGNPRSQYDTDWNNVAPRLGAVFSVSPRTTLRGAWGRFFGPSPVGAQGTVGPYGFRVETPWVTSLDNLTPLNYLRNPFPQGFGPVPGAAAGLMTGVGGRIEAPLHHAVSPSTWQWNAGLQQELPSRIVVDAAYVGNRGRDLSLGGEGGYTLNQLDPQYLTLGPALNELVPNPFYGLVTTGALAQPTVARGQLLRPYPQFGDVIPLFLSGAQSAYDALQLSVRRRFSDQVSFDASYVLSRSRDWGQSYQNAYDPASHDSLSGVHVPHRFVMNGIYVLPFEIQVAGIWTIQSGSTLGISGTNSSGAFNQGFRVNWNGEDAAIDGDAKDKLAKWFDPSVFSQPAPFTFGNAPERIPGLRADYVNNVDLAVMKQLRLTARVRMELRLEAFNLFNRVQFGSPNTTVTSPSVGQVTSQANTPRQVQAGIKALW